MQYRHQVASRLNWLYLIVRQTFMKDISRSYHSAPPWFQKSWEQFVFQKIYIWYIYIYINNINLITITQTLLLLFSPQPHLIFRTTAVKVSSQRAVNTPQWYTILWFSNILISSGHQWCLSIYQYHWWIRISLVKDLPAIQCCWPKFLQNEFTLKMLDSNYIWFYEYQFMLLVYCPPALSLHFYLHNNSEPGCSDSLFPRCIQGVDRDPTHAGSHRPTGFPGELSSSGSTFCSDIFGIM